jgi:uncharacterized protein (TIGR00159 family)
VESEAVADLTHFLITDKIFAMHILPIINDLRFQDVLDVLFLTVVAYHLHLWFRGTKAFKALIGLLVLGSIYTLARFWGLFLTTWAFQILWQVLLILIIILFQSEIRQVLERVNPLQTIVLRKSSSPEQWIPGFVKAVSELAKRKIGALIVIERVDLVDELVTEGQQLEGAPTPEILLSIFQKDSPIHDGAVLIRRGSISQVACYLPLSSAEKLPKQWGTRHRAALGLSEKCDACVVVVSEERGDVSIARDGQMIHIDKMAAFSEIIKEATRPVSFTTKTKSEKIQFLLSNRWHAKWTSLALVCFLWLLFAGQQNFKVTFPVYVNMKNIPSDLEIVETVRPKLEITVEGLRKDASTLSERNVFVEIDLSRARPGKRIFTVTRDLMSFPTDRVHVVNIQPNKIEFQFREKPTKNMQRPDQEEPSS